MKKKKQKEKERKNLLKTSQFMYCDVMS